MTKRFDPLAQIKKRYNSWKQKIDFVKEQYLFYIKTELTLMRIIRPKLFSEKMQWRKLFDTSAIFKQFSDRIAVQSFIRKMDLAEMLVPQLWVGSDPHEIPFDSLPRPFVLKSTHASGHVVIVQSGVEYDWQAIAQQASAWLDVCYGTDKAERGYIGVPRRLVVEPLLTCRDGTPPMELKIFVYDGVTKIFQYNFVDKNRNYIIGYLDENWQIYPWKTTLTTAPEKPIGLELAVNAANRICAGLDHCRVDFYFADENIYIGEVTPYCWSGMVMLEPSDVDAIMGSFWKLRFPTIRALSVMASSDWGEN